MKRCTSQLCLGQLQDTWFQEYARLFLLCSFCCLPPSSPSFQRGSNASLIHHSSAPTTWSRSDLAPLPLPLPFSPSISCLFYLFIFVYCASVSSFCSGFASSSVYLLPFPSFQSLFSRSGFAAPHLMFVSTQFKGLKANYWHPPATFPKAEVCLTHSQWAFRFCMTDITGV